MANFSDLLTYYKVDCTGNGETFEIKDILFREKKIEFLLSFMRPSGSLPYPSLFIYGYTATGKTFTLSKLVQKYNIPHVWINCHEYYTSRAVFKFIISQLDEANLHNNYSVCEFVNSLKHLLKNKLETMYLIFDAAEKLLKEDSFLLTILLKLQDLVRENVCTIFISELPWLKFNNVLNTITPISLHFSNYTKDEICKILSMSCPENYSSDFYEAYISVILKTFFPVTRNLRELQHLAEINFEKYCEPLEDPNLEPSDFKLWKNIEPVLKEAMSTVYLREIAGSKWKQSTINSDKLYIKPFLNSKYDITQELPFYSKFLLISSYFASYNAPKSDFKHFVKNQGKQRKRKIVRKVEKNRHLLGPKPFTLDRLLSIFFSIVGERVLPSAVLFSQISSLVSMRLLSQISSDEQIDCPKYKCLAELDLMDKIGKTVGLDVMQYLDDFL